MEVRRVKKHRRAGFTLIEILLVLAIVGVIAAMAVPNLLGQQRTALSRQSKIAVADLEKAADLWAIPKGGEYPASLQVLTQKGEDGTPPVLVKVPTDGWGNQLNYEYPNTKANSDKPAIWSNGPNKINDNGSGDDINNWADLIQ